MNYRSGIRRDKYDALFSCLVRERSDWACEYCGKRFGHDPHSLHCSHLFGRRKQSVRLHPWNAFAHCRDCHQRLGEHPVEFAEWARFKLGSQKYDALRVLASRPTKFTVAERELIHRHYLNEKTRMQILRRQGWTGRLEFSWALELAA